MACRLREERARPRTPLLFPFHGTGSSAADFAGLAAELMPEASHTAPRGDLRERAALRFLRRRAEGFSHMDDLARRSAAMAGFVAAQTARRAPPRTVGLGSSDGANIRASAAVLAPGLFDPVILMHPLIPFRPGPAALAGLAMLITAGRRDPIAPAAATEVLARALAEDGAAVRLVWHEGGHALRRDKIEAARRVLADGGRAAAGPGAAGRVSRQ